MSYQAEIKKSIALLQSLKAQYALLHCNSTYPPHFRDIHLKFIQNLASLGDHVVGYSGHERGAHIPVAAVAMGARIIEKHFTVDRNMEGSDHKVSLLPGEFSVMVSQIRDLELALGENADRKPNQGELMNRANLAKSLMINRDLAQGEIITNEMLEVKSPGRGLQPILPRSTRWNQGEKKLSSGGISFSQKTSVRRRTFPHEITLFDGSAESPSGTTTIKLS